MPVMRVLALICFGSSAWRRAKASQTMYQRRCSQGSAVSGRNEAIEITDPSTIDEWLASLSPRLHGS
jgi:hypothetical protein